ncbi:MAG: sn-glycerol-3-phosphate ABC transporter ATP-binding protein UgpC [FCB group bacterium]|nr:sn-glycerol-3-phosphate ABC transporter ATP-binding protein UgpC [FCB group bacterium]
MSLVSLKSIHKSFGATTVLSDINLQIRDGEFLVLVGPSGCGKSTTLRLVAGLETPTSGDIYIGDTRVNEMDPKDRDIAMVFQNYALYPHMNVYENMAFGLKIRKQDPDLIRTRVEEAADILQIGDLLKRKPRELSGGQRQRVALGRALVRKPKVFLFDEPLSNLDAKLRSEMRIEIKRLHKLLATTMIYVTHDQVEAMTMGDRIAVMNRGNIEQLDTPKTTYDKPNNKFVAGFIGTPQMNFIEGSVYPGKGGHIFKAGSFQIDIGKHPSLGKNERRVVMGIRPENISPVTEGSAHAERQDTFTAEVEITEPLGSSLLAHLVVGGFHLTANFDGNLDIKMGETIEVKIDQGKIHLFDLETKEKLID